MAILLSIRGEGRNTASQTSLGGPRQVQSSDKDGYSPYENPMMAELVNQTNVKTVYVAGIALEYCVRATCLDTIKFKKQVILIEPLVRSVSKDEIVLAKQWDKLINAGIIRGQKIDGN